MWGFSSGFHHQLQWSSAVLSDSRSHAKQGVRAVIEETCRLILLDIMSQYIYCNCNWFGLNTHCWKPARQQPGNSKMSLHRGHYSNVRKSYSHNPVLIEIGLFNYWVGVKIKIQFIPNHIKHHNGLMLAEIDFQNGIFKTLQSPPKTQAWNNPIININKLEIVGHVHFTKT